MKDLIVTPLADADLIAIYDYTADRWGLAQADRYLGEIHSRIAGLCDGQTVSSSAAEVRDGLRRVVAGRHVVFLRESEAVVEVVRVLHQREDVGRV